MTRAPLILNEDCNHFVYSRKAEELTPEGIDALVDAYARDTQVSHLAFNVNANRSAVPSKVKQTLWDGFDPKAGDDQPFFKGVTEGLDSYRHWVANMRLLQDRGIDLYTRWFARTREYGVVRWPRGRA